MPSPNPPISSFAGKKVIVMGLGHFGGGLGAAQWLVSQQAQVIVTDAAVAEKLAEPLRALQGLPITYRLGGHDAADLAHADLLVVNPAVERTQSAFVQAALQAGVPATTEMNLFLERCCAQTIGITGSVGKSTTTALIYEALKAALGQTSVASGQCSEHPPTDHRPLTTDHASVFLGGNIGRSLLFDLPSIRPQDFVVLELSSFMLEETPQIRWSPHVAIVTNIFPNHLDRHGTMEAYTAAKQNILRFQTPNDIAVLNGDHELVSRWDGLARGKAVHFTARDPAAHLDLAMPGAHNQSNAAAALAVLEALQIPLDRPAALRALRQFPGLAHRLQCVHTLDLPGAPPRRLRFYNDSKATSPDASVTAVEAFAPGRAIFIVGGYDKHLPPESFDAFDRLMARRALAVVGIGQTGWAMIDRIQNHAAAPSYLRAQYAQILDQAVPLAHAWAGELGAEAVVLSPASASWDQFPNYEKRGDLFAELARKLA